MRVRRFAVATLAAALMLGMAGCADDEGTTSDSKDAEATAPVAIGANLTVGNFGEQVAAAQMDSRSAHIEGTTSLGNGQDLTLSGDVQVGASLDEFKLAMVAEMADQGSIEFRLIAGTVYVKLPAMLSSSAAKPWVMVDLSDPDNPIGAIFNQLMSSLDPSKLEQLYTAVEDLENLGQEDVNGVSTTHYRVSVDTAKVLEILGSGEVAGIHMDEMLQDMPKSVTSDVWVDDDALLVKTAIEFDGSMMEMNYSQWGEPITVTAPPARQVGKLSL